MQRWDRVERADLDRVEPLRTLQQRLCERHEVDRGERAFGLREHTLSAAEPSQLDDQQLTGEPRIELRERRAYGLRIRLTEHHPAECRCIDADAGTQ